MALNDIYLATLEFTTWDVNHSISFHVRDDFDISAGEGPNTLVGDLDTALTALFAAALSDDTVLEAWYARNVVKEQERPGLKQLNDQKGTDLAASYPPNTCAVFSFRGEDAALKRNGRFYLGGLPKDKIEAGKLDPAYLAGALANIGNAFEAPIVGAGSWQPGVFRTIDAGLPIPGGQFVIHDEVVIDPITYSQRRRTSKSRGMSA